MDFFTKTIDGWKSLLIFSESSILNFEYDSQSSEYAFKVFQKFPDRKKKANSVTYHVFFYSLFYVNGNFLFTKLQIALWI